MGNGESESQGIGNATPGHTIQHAIPDSRLPIPGHQYTRFLGGTVSTSSVIVFEWTGR
jgi:hypothetical protein